MTEREFCYWLQGLFEVANPTQLDAAQTAMIKDHLSLVMTKVTPDRGTVMSFERLQKVVEPYCVSELKRHDPIIKTYCTDRNVLSNTRIC